MLLIIKPDKGFGKIEVEIPDELYNRILELSEAYGVSPERVFEIILTDEFKSPKENLEKLENKIKELQKKTGELEKIWAPLRYKAYGVSEDNKILAIELSGLLAENMQLKRFLRKKIEKNIELRKLIEYYMQ